MAMSTSHIEKAFAGKAFTTAQKPALRARVSRSALVCKASQEKKTDVVLKAAGAALGAIAAVQLGLAGPAAADINFDSARSGAPPQNKDAVNLPSTFFKTGDTLQEKLGFTEDARDQGGKVGQASFPNASQEDFKIEKTAKDAQKGLEKSFQNVTPDTSDLPNPFDGAGAGSIADKAKGAAKDVGKNLNPGSSNLPNPSAAADKASGALKGLAGDVKQGTKNVSLDLSELPNPFNGAGAGSIADKAKGAAKDVGKSVNPNSSNLPNPSAAADKASGAIKGLVGDAKQGAKNVSLDLSENIPNPFYDTGSNAEKAKQGAVDQIGKSDLPSLPSPGGAVDKAAGALKGLAGDAKQGSKNVASDLSENIPNPFYDTGSNAEKAKQGAVDQIGKSDLPSLPSPGGAVDKAAGALKGLAGDAKQGSKNVASDLSENPLDGAIDKARGAAKDLGKNVNSGDLPDPSAAADKLAGNAKGLASDAKSTVKQEANVAGDVSDLPNPFDGAGGIADQAKGAVKDVGKNLNPGSSNLPDPSAAADKAAGKAKSLASDATGTVKGLKANPNT